MGVHEAPRGALAHWVRITDGYITSYEATIPTTWLASPRGHNGEYGAYEYALLGHKIADPKRPLEIIRTIHSYDPCMACSAHILSPDGKTYSKVKVQ
jgi:Ni,Fe-hydrogenase I large subunit